MTTSTAMENDELVELLDDLTESRPGLAEHTAEGLSLRDKRDKQYMLTPLAYKVPVRIEAETKTNSSNIRLKYGKGFLIFNWENNPEELRVHEPAKGRGERHGDHGSGLLPKNEWVKLTWIIEADHMRVLVNGEERYRAAGSFGSVSGQAGIGPAWGSIVTVKSFRVSGESRKVRKVQPKPRYFQFDCSHLALPSDRHDELTEWYGRHLGMTVRIPCGTKPPELQKTILRYEKGGTVCFISGDPANDHYHVHWDKPSDIRLCFQAHDIKAAHRYMQNNGIRTTELSQGPSNRLWFDFYDPAGTRLTAVAGLRKTDVPPDAPPLARCDLSVIGVSDLRRSADWYCRTFDLKLNSRRSNERFVLLTGNWMHHEEPNGVLWLEYDATRSARQGGKTNSAQRPYIYLEKEQFDMIYEKLREQGHELSEVAGRAFHLYDPDGNRINLYTY